jgi:hypothetical protein
MTIGKRQNMKGGGIIEDGEAFHSVIANERLGVTESFFFPRASTIDFNCDLLCDDYQHETLVK